MQEIISFVVNTISAFINVCLNNELLFWTIVLFIVSVGVYIFSALWRK